MSGSDQMLFVGVQGYVYALEKASGTIAWSSASTSSGKNPTIIHPHPPTSSLLVSSGPKLWCLSALTGGKIWENPLHGIGSGYSMVALEPSSNAYTISTAAATEAMVQISGYVFVACNRTVRAVRLSDGADLWEFVAPEACSCSVLPALLVEDGILYVSGDRHVWALNPHNGKQVWRTKLPLGDSYHTLATMRSSALCRPARFDPSSVEPYEITKSSVQNLLFASASGFITSIEREQGHSISANHFGDIKINVLGHPVVQTIPLPSSNTAIVTAGANICRISLTNGETLWENKLDGMGVGILSVLVGGGIAPIDELPPYDGTSLSTLSPGGTPNSAPSIDRAFVSLHGKIYRVRISDGATLWRYKPPVLKRILQPAHLLPDSFGRIYVAGSGSVHCVDAETGSKVWVSKELRRSFATLSSYATGNGETNRSSVFLPVILRSKEDDRPNSTMISDKRKYDADIVMLTLAGLS
ncbi:quinon protein alcohol dehydrogenase-like superfamily [Cladochytrium replicatum]|nr:quinon protein alcohol dehydrogenase-like superfamily [Cladochytrium replicatum]